MIRFLIRCNKIFKKRPFYFFTIIAILSLGLMFIAKKISFKEDISSFLPHSKETELINFVYENNKLSDKIIISIALNKSSEDSVTALMDGVDLLRALIVESANVHIDEILSEIDQNTISEVQNTILENLPVFVSETELKALEKNLTDTTLSKIIAKNKELLLMPSGGFVKDNILNDPLHLSGSTLKKIQKLGEFQKFNTDNGYFFSPDNKKVYLFIVAKNAISETKENAIFVKKLEASLQKFEKESNGLYKTSHFGAIPVSVTNAKQIKQDSIISMIIALLLIIIILLLYFKKISHLILIIIPVFFGALLSIAFIVIFKGGISTIAIGASSAIFGIALNYSLHFLIHYKETQSTAKTIKEISFPMIVGSITTVGAFLSLLFVKSDALKDFGLFSAFTLIGTLIFVILILPQFFKKDAQHNAAHTYSSNFWNRIATARIENIPYIGLIILILTIIFGYYSSSVKFDTDFNNLSYMTKDQKKALAEISEVSKMNAPYLYHISTGKNLEEALENYENAFPIIDSLNGIGYFDHIQGIGDFIHSEKYNQKRIAHWNQFWQEKGAYTIQRIEYESEKNGFFKESFSSFTSLIDTPFTLQNINISPLRAVLLDDYIIEKPGQTVIVTLLYPTVEIQKIVDSPLAAVPNTIMFNRTMSNKSMVTLLYSDFNKVLLICALLVTFFLFISFGRIELSLIALLPMVFGWIWILGLMSIFGIQFNIVNIILATFIFGLGDDYSIFMMEGLIQEYGQKKDLVVSYKTAVILSAVTMFIGIGTLIISKHPAMRSLAEVSMVGMISVVIMTYTISPLVFKSLVYKKGKSRIQPITLVDYVITVYSFLWFLLGCLALNLLIPILLIPFTSLSYRKKIYHQIFCYLSKLCTQRVPFVKFNILGYDKQKFEKPCIIISNHQSHIDLTGLLGLHPNIIALTNKWVWNLPFYGLPLRFADFYPIADNMENSVDKLEEIVKKGYSILIFPEGTRSENCSINRFHKGAFYLAEKLNLDILPITLHGFGHILPKKELCLRKGEISIHIGDLIKKEEYQQLGGYQNVSKWARKAFVSQYNKIASEIETPDYWSNRVAMQYIYKGMNIEWEVKRNLKKNSNYATLISELKQYKNVKFVNCGYGELPYLTAMVLKNTQVFAFESNEEKYAIAQNCANIPSNLHYVEHLESPCEIIIDIQTINKQL